MTDVEIVMASYPQAKLVKDISYGKTETFVICDDQTKQYVGPWTFEEQSAWFHAAQRLRVPNHPWGGR